MVSRPQRVVVIGAGLGGLSAAAHLSGRPDREVVLLERDPRPGGRAGLIEADGFRLDNGPTVLTMPNLLADAFAAAGADMADFVTVRRSTPCTAPCTRTVRRSTSGTDARR